MWNSLGVDFAPHSMGQICPIQCKTHLWKGVGIVRIPFCKFLAIAEISGISVPTPLPGPAQNWIFWGGRWWTQRPDGGYTQVAPPPAMPAALGAGLNDSANPMPGASSPPFAAPGVEGPWC